jgi:outer membrane PBP1 activator LpoA protein
MEVLSTSRRALGLALALLLTACPKTTTPVRGGGGGGNTHVSPGDNQFPTQPTVEAKEDAGADAALAQAVETAARTPDKHQAAEVLMTVRKTYPATTAGQEALYRAGILYFEAEDYANARKAFNELLFENPLYPEAEDAKHKLALSAMEVGAYRDAYQTLSSLAERAEGAERDRLLQEAARAAEGAGMFGPALDIAVKAAEDAKTPEEQAAAVARVEQLVEGRVSFVDVARVVEDMSPRHPAWPVLTFKLARIYYHLRDWTRLEETLNRFLQETPTHPFATQARDLLARATRRVDVSPRTVGVLLPMTGRYKPIGEAVLRGVQLALAGSNIELVVKDTQGEVMLAGQAVEQLAFDEGAIAVLGPLLPDDSRRAALVAEELQVPQHADQLRAGAGHRRLRNERARLQELRGALPEHPLRRGDGQRLLGRGGAERRHRPRRGELHARPDDLHRRGQEARGPLLPGGSGRLPGGHPRHQRREHGRLPQAQGGGEAQGRPGSGGGLRCHLHPG